MNPLEDIAISLYGKNNITFIPKNNILCRNQSLSFDLRDGRKLFMKLFSSKRHFERESFLYNLFGQTRVFNTPRLGYVGDGFIILQRLNLCQNLNIYQMLRDLARLHGSFSQIESEVNERIKQQTLFKIDKSNIEQILNKIGFYSRKVENFLARDLKNLPPNAQRLIHGDLYSNNVLLDEKGDLAYIDFENSKVDWPEKDNVLIALYNPQLYRKIINFYSQERMRYGKVNGKEIEFSMRYLTVLKLSEMLHNLNVNIDNYTDQLKKTEFADMFKKAATGLIGNLVS